MKVTKTKVRNTMTDDRLNDLCASALKRDADVSFEELIDDFANIHQNNWRMLK